MVFGCVRTSLHIRTNLKIIFRPDGMWWLVNFSWGGGVLFFSKCMPGDNKNFCRFLVP